MKNIHLLPTHKLTTLFKDDFGNLIYSINMDQEQNHFKPQHLFITSDEEIKWDDWVYCPVLKRPVFISLDGVLMLKNLDYDSNGNSKYKKEWLKKIILTTDQDLIKRGVQPIDDKFLEWFIQVFPTCKPTMSFEDDFGNFS